jgi:hypothetical protein
MHQAPAVPQPKPSSGLDFSQGIIIEGELKKKRANLVVRWRKKYFVLSRNYGAMFFWTGGKNSVEGVIKKVRFDTFLSLKQLEKYGGKRVDLRVITGRRMKLLANSPEEVCVRCPQLLSCLFMCAMKRSPPAFLCSHELFQAKRWIDTIKAHLGHLMGAIRIQCAYRAYRARKILKRLIAERAAAVKTVWSIMSLTSTRVAVAHPLLRCASTGHCKYEFCCTESRRRRRAD